MAAPHPGLVGRPVYLDYNGTTPIDPAVVEAMAPYLSVEFGNPSSTHAYGVGASVALARAREQVSSLVSGRGGRVVFTSSGSEADALAIRGAVLAAIDAARTPVHVVTQVTEHPAVLAACRYLEQRHAVLVTYLGVDAHGRVDPDELGAALTQDTVLVSIMHANNETGTLQPVAEIAAITRDHGVLLHCDAAQSIGKVEVDVDALGVDLLTIVGHKMHAPKGIAALYVREGVALVPLVGGGGQESGLRAGTENVPYIVGLGAAAKLAAEALSRGESRRLVALRDRMHVELEAGLPGRVHLNGHPGERLPNTLNVSIDGVPALGLLASAVDLAASAGSACHAGHDEPSPVLTAMGLPAAVALTAIRLSVGRWTTAEDAARAAAALITLAE